MKSLVVSFFLVGIFAVAQDGVFAFNECEELSLKQKDLDGKKYTFSKCLDKNNNIFEIVRDHKGNIVKNFNGRSKNNPIHQDVKYLLSNNIKDNTLKVLISLKVDPSEELTSAPSSGEAIIENGSTVSL